MLNPPWIGARPQKIVAAVSVLGIFAAGCATSYRPHEPGRISFVLDGPGVSLYKDGATYSATGLSSDPIRSVAGNPGAEAEARTFVRRSRIWWTLYGVAVASLVTSIAVGANAPDHSERLEVSAGFGLSGLALLLGSLAVAFTTPSHLYDAVNVYNDGLGRPNSPPLR